MLYYISQIYGIFLTAALTPVFIYLVTKEGYGLIAIGSLVLAWIQVIETGFTQAISRSVSYSTQHYDSLNSSLRNNLRITWWIVMSLSFIIFIASDPLSHLISQRWLLKDGHMSSISKNCIYLVGLTGAIRLLILFPRAIIYGSNKLKTLGLSSFFLINFRYLLTIAVYFLVDSKSPLYFFICFLAVSVVEFFLFTIIQNSIIPIRTLIFGVIDFRNFKSFSNIIVYASFASFVWCVTTTSDKVILSKILDLKDFALLNLITIAAGSIAAISSPLISAYLPSLLAKYSHDELSSSKYEYFIYRFVLYTSLTSFLGAIVTLCSWDLLFLWTRDRTIADDGYKALLVYGLGFIIQAYGGLSYYILLAKGELKRHLWGSIFFAVIYLCLLFSVADEYGILGAGFSWLISNFVYLYVWVPFVFRKEEGGLLIKILFSIPLKTLGGAIVFSLPFVLFFDYTNSTFHSLFKLFSVVFLSGVGLLIACEEIRTELKLFCRNFSSPFNL